MNSIRKNSSVLASASSLHGGVSSTGWRVVLSLNYSICKKIPFAKSIHYTEWKTSVTCRQLYMWYSPIFIFLSLAFLKKDRNENRLQN